MSKKNPKTREGEATSKELSKPYEPTPEEKAIVEAQKAKRKAKIAPKFKVSRKDGNAQIMPDHPDIPTGLALLMEATGTADVDFFIGLATQLSDIAQKNGEVSEQPLNFMLSVIKGVEPKDQLEAMLAAQMAATHNAAMVWARNFKRSESIMEIETAERVLNKLNRTFAMQMETLKKYRSNGEQKVTVQHVQVNEGGKAIVGNVNHTGGG